jgi:prephenate dehydratase
MRIAIQGELGSFSHQATLQIEPEAILIPCALSPEVFRSVLSGEADAAVIPIENSLAGSVVEHFDLLFQSDVRIEREFSLRIRHNLIAAPGSKLEDIRQVLSHPVALAQCRRFFAAHPAMTPSPFYDTAGAVKHTIELGDRAVAAIAGEQAARTYNGLVLEAGIEDNPANFTRFFLLRRTAQVHQQPDADKVSIAFSVKNRPGTLVAALQVFADHHTNLCKIESRPVHGQPWEYIFYVDFQVADPAVPSAVLQQLKRQCLLVKELGYYPAARLLS